jgi:hypothetical protein
LSLKRVYARLRRALAKDSPINTAILLPGFAGAQPGPAARIFRPPGIKRYSAVVQFRQGGSDAWSKCGRFNDNTCVCAQPNPNTHYGFCGRPAKLLVLPPTRDLSTRVFREEQPVCIDQKYDGRYDGQQFQDGYNAHRRPPQKGAIKLTLLGPRSADTATRGHAPRAHSIGSFARTLPLEVNSGGRLRFLVRCWPCMAFVRAATAS